MKIIRSCSLAAALVAAISLARPAHAETLADVIAYAYQTSPPLQAQRAAQRALDESYVQARSGEELNITASTGGTSYTDRRAGTTAYANTGNGSLSITQPLYTGGRVHSRINEAEAQILAGRQTLRRAELELLQKVVTAYSDVLRDMELLKISQDTVAALQKEVGDTDARFQVREVTQTDVAQSKARLAQAQTQLLNARTALAVSRAEFFGVVGQNPGSLAPLPALEDLPKTIDSAFEAAENNNPQLLAAQYTEQGSRARIAEARAGALPTVSLQATLQHSPYLPYLNTPYDDIASASIVLNQPIFSGGQISSSIRQAVQENNRDRFSIDDVHRQLVQAVSAAWEQLAGSRDQLSTLDSEVKADEYALYGVEQEQKLALRATIDVLNAELELTNAQQSLTRTRAAEYVNRLQLLTLIGLLSPKTLSPDVELYDPVKNFRNIEWRGSTPLDLPVRILDGLGGIKIGPEKPASVADLHPDGAVLPPPPAEPSPRTSILSTLDEAPPTP